MIAPGNSQRTWARLIPDWLCGAFFLAVPALYNSYPLVTSDSGAYIANGYELQVPLDRPLAYSIFVRLASLDISMWGVVLLQAMTVSWLLLLLSKYLLGAAYRRTVFAAITALLGIATSAGWFVGQIMPDIFTAVLLLSIFLLSVMRMSRTTTICIYAAMLFSIMMHNSNMLIALLLGVILIVYTWRRRQDLLRHTAFALLATGVISWLTMSTMNAVAGKGFRPSAASHVFIASRMVENGIMNSFLEQYCPVDTPAYRLCAYQQQLPNRQWDFMWGDDKSPLYATGGWVGNEKEFNRIIYKSLLRPKYLALHIVKNSQATLRQLPLIYVGDGLGPYDGASSPYKRINKYRWNELKEFSSAMQQTNELHLQLWNVLIAAFALISCITALLIRPRPARPESVILPALRRLVKLALLFMLINAAVTATLATVVGRYEARIFWLLPFLSCIYIIRRFTADEDGRAIA